MVKKVREREMIKKEEEEGKRSGKDMGRPNEQIKIIVLNSMSYINQIPEYIDNRGS